MYKIIITEISDSIGQDFHFACIIRTHVTHPEPEGNKSIFKRQMRAFKERASSQAAEFLTLVAVRCVSTFVAFLFV